MGVLMVNIGGMRMLVFRLFVSMRVAMFTHNLFAPYLQIVQMLVVPVVVPMRMFVLDAFVAMHMTMEFREV